MLSSPGIVSTHSRHTGRNIVMEIEPTLPLEDVENTLDISPRFVVQVFPGFETLNIMLCSNKRKTSTEDSSKVVNNVFGRIIPTLYHLLYQVGNFACRILLMTVSINGGIDEGRDQLFAVGTSSSLLPVHGRIVYSLVRQRM